MAGELVTGYLRLVPTVDGIQGATATAMLPAAAEADKAGKRTGGRFSRAFSPAIKGVGGALAGLFAARAIGGFLKDSIAEAREAQKVGALTAQVIKSTGGAANITAAEVGKLAGSLSNKVGIDDEVIQSGANLLLTFKNIRNEAGLGNDIFNQATASAVDLSAAGFGSVSSASKQLGKALNDPLKGVSALGRAGVTFTEKQKALIKGFVEQGDMLSAQKIILGEVKSQVGGAAAASATAGEKLAVSWGNFKETIGTALLPLIDKLAAFLADKLLPGILAMGPAITKGIAAIRSFFSGLNAGTGSAGTKFAQFQATIASVWASVQSIFTSGVTIVTALWNMFGSTIVSFLRGWVTNTLNMLRGLFTAIQGIFNIFAGILTGDWSRVWTGIKQLLSGVWTAIKALISQGWNIIKSIFRAAGIAVKAIFVGLWNGLVSAARAGANKVIDAVKALPGKIKGVFKGAGSWLKSIGQDIMNGLLKGIDKGIDKVKSKIAGVGKLIPGNMKKVLGIGSPSRVMAREVGRWILPGVGVGVDGTISQLRRRIGAAMASATTGLGGTPLAVAAGSSMATTGISPSVSGGGPTVQQIIYPQPQQSEREIGDAAADRALWAMR